MLARWRNQRNAKQLEEEEEQRAGSKPEHGPAPALPHGPSSAPLFPASDPSSPRSPTSTAFHSTATPELPSTLSSPDEQCDAEVSGLPGTPSTSVGAEPASAAHESASASASSPAMEGVADAPAPGESASGDAQIAPTPSPKDEAQARQEKPNSGEQVIARDVTSADQEEGEKCALSKDTSITKDNLDMMQGTFTSEKERQNGIGGMPHVEDSCNKVLPRADSGDFEISKSKGGSVVMQPRQETQISGNINKKSNSIVDSSANELRAKIEEKSPRVVNGKSSVAFLENVTPNSEQEHSETECSESPTHSSQTYNGWQTHELGRPDSVCTELEREDQMQIYVQESRKPLKGAPRTITKEITSRPLCPYETVNYLSELAAVKCARRIYGAAKASKVSGSAIFWMERGAHLVAVPAFFVFTWCDKPLLFADRMISKCVKSIFRVCSCPQSVANICCDVLGGECNVPIAYIGNETQMGRKLKQSRENVDFVST